MFVKNKNMIIKTLLPFSLLILCNAVFSQAPKYSNEFLSIGVGARALAMSNANVAIVGDASSGFWNPAGLLNVKGDLQIAAMHNELFAGIAKYDYAAIAHPIDSMSAVGFSFNRFGTDNIPNTIEFVNADGNFDYDKIKSFSAVDYAFLFSYAKKSKINGLHYGVNAKVIHRIVGDFASTWGFGLDAGLRYQKGNWKFGAMGKDITSTFNAWNYTLDDRTKEVWGLTENEIPENSVEITLPKLILGSAYKYTFKDKYSVLPELDLDMTFDKKRNVLVRSNLMSIDPHLGIEFGYDDFVFFRGGIYNIQTIKDFDGTKTTIVQPNMGVGVKLKNLTLDYALANIGGQGGIQYSNIFSLKLDIYKKQKLQ